MGSEMLISLFDHSDTNHLYVYVWVCVETERELGMGRVAVCESVCFLIEGG